MLVKSFLCCEGAKSAHDGLVDLSGVGVSHFVVDGFPAKVTFFLYSRLAAEVTDALGKKTARARIMAEDRKLGEMTWQFEMLNEEYSVNLTVPIVFGATREGSYRIELSVDENPEATASWPLGIALGKKN